MRFVSVLRSGVDEWLRAVEEAGARPVRRRPLLVALLLGVLSFGFFSSMAPSAMPSGDAALYAQQARTLDLSERTVHIGYYLAASVWVLFQADAPDIAFNLFSCALGGATVALVILLGANWFGRLDLGVVAGLSLLGSVTFWRQAAWAEVYVGQAFLFVLAFWLILRAGRSWGSWTAPGVALAGSVLFSPSTLLGVPGLIALRPRWRNFIGLGLAGGGVVLVFLVFVWRDYFLGPRGLFGAAPTSGGPIQAVIKEGVEVVFGVGALLPLLALGAWSMLYSIRGRGWLFVLGVLWAPTFLFGERYPDVPVQLPTWILLAPVVATGFQALGEKLALGWTARSVWMTGATVLAALPFLAIPFIASRSRSFAALGSEFIAVLLTAVVVSAALALWLSKDRPQTAIWVVFSAWAACGSALSVQLVGDQNEKYETYRAQVLELKELAEVDYVAVGSWEQSLLLEHYIYGRPYTGHTINLDAWSSGDAEAVRAIDLAVTGGRELWLLRSSPALEARLAPAGLEPVRRGAFQVFKATNPRTGGD
ncbi:MAG: hypothetical protein AAGM22_11205 [Acidobacteriota bacterium]